MSSKTKLFLILLAAGLLGIASFLFVDLAALIKAMPLPPGEPPPSLPPPALFKIISLIQPGVLTTLAVLVGCWLSPRVGLSAPASEALANGEGAFTKLKPEILPGVIAGLVSGVAIVASWVVAKPYLSAAFVDRAQEFNKFMPHITRFLYGGFTEEILLRWGVMTFLVWVPWRLFQKGKGTPRATYFVGAIVISAMLFGIGHLPIASMLAGSLTLPLVVYVITANSIFGIVAGFLYWRRGLEAAIIAHMSAHLVLIGAIYLAF